MSVRHLWALQEMTEPGTRIPVREVLMLPDNLQLCPDGSYDPTAFGVPGGPPRLLGTQYPVIVDGDMTFIFLLTKDSFHTYAKLRA